MTTKVRVGTVTVRIRSDWTPLRTHATVAFFAAADDVLEEARRVAPPDVSGRYRRGLRVYQRTSRKGPGASISNRKVPYSNVLEFGGGPHAGWARKGPHVQRANAPRPLGKVADTPFFADAYTRRLRSTPMHAASFVRTEFGGGLGIPSLELSGL